MEEIQKIIEEECDKVKSLLLKKNADYGSSFARPILIFSKMNAEEQVDVRIDDKLRRIKNLRDNQPNIHEDTELDLIGYLILKRVLRRLKDE